MAAKEIVPSPRAGKTRWFARSLPPVREGLYECIGRLYGGLTVKILLRWDGIGFLVPYSLSVVKWRGLTKKEYDKITKNGIDRRYRVKFWEKHINR